MSDWTFEGEIVTQEMVAPFVSFVYRITSPTGRIYYGKKLTTKAKTLPPLKGKTRKRKSRVPSEWAKYWGSNEDLKAEVKLNGKEGYTREILRLCGSKAEASYWEAYHIITSHALLDPTQYYNRWCDIRCHGSHLQKTPEALTVRLQRKADEADNPDNWIELTGMTDEEVIAALSVKN